MIESFREKIWKYLIHVLFIAISLFCVVFVCALRVFYVTSRSDAEWLYPDPVGFFHRGL